MSLYTWLLFAHVLGAIGWLGGGFMLTLVALDARLRSTPEALTEFARTMPYVGPRVLLPSSLVVPVTGVWMVLINAGWRFSQLWILLAIGLFGLAFVIGAVQVGRIGIQLTRLGLESNLAQCTEGVAGEPMAWLVQRGPRHPGRGGR